MSAVTIERIRELDVVCGQEVVDLVRHLRLATFQHEDNVAKIRELALRLGSSPVTVSKYIWLQTFIAELGSSYDDVPSPEVVADHLEIPWSDFENYFLDRAEVIHDFLEVPDDFRPRQKKMPLQTMAPWEEED